MQDYKYEPLGRGEIRLLQLKPRRPGANEALTGTIKRLKLQNPTYHAPPPGDETPGWLEYPTRYEAVSYHWGSDKNTPYSLVIDNESSIRLTVQLYTVLHRLVPSDVEERVLWVDAICINQVDENTSEKGEQIDLMPHIYRCAVRALVYLGDIGSDTGLTFALIDKIAAYSEYLQESLNTGPTSGVTAARAKGLDLPPPNDRSWKALQRFWTLPWFRRMWIIQEFVLANEVIVSCGDGQIDWRKLWLASNAYCDNGQLLFADFQRSGGQAQVQELHAAHNGARAMAFVGHLRLRSRGYMSQLYMLMTMTSAPGVPAVDIQASGMREGDGMVIPGDLAAISWFENIPIVRRINLQMRAEGDALPYGRSDMFDLLMQTTTFDASHKEDRMIALLGLVEGGSDSDFTSIKPPPDTAVEVPDAAVKALEIAVKVNSKFAAALLRRGQCVQNLLGKAGIRSADDPLPSWVPDWMTASDASDGKTGFCPRMSFGRQNEPRRQEDMGGGGHASNGGAEFRPRNEEAMPFYWFRAARDSLVEYRLLDEFILVLKGNRVDSVAEVFPEPFRRSLREIERAVATEHRQYPTGEPMREVLWRALISNRTISGQRAPAEFGHQYELLKESVGGASLIATYASWPAYYPPPEVSGYIRSLNLTMTKYSLGVTAKGYLGLFPPLARRGDDVVIFYGCDAPFVIRARDTRGTNHYRLVGESYIHGIMEGELFEGPGWSAEKICLH